MARSSRAPISFEAATAVAKARGALLDRLTHSLPLSAIQPSPRNPRQDMGAVAELADSLRAHGLLQPVVVRRRTEGYELIAGHRRCAAAKVLGWTEIAAVVRDETDEQAYILTLVENLQREDLSPREEATALEVLVRERGWSTRQIGEAIKRSHVYVSKRLRVFEDDYLAAPVLAGQLPVSTAEELLRAPDEAREQLAKRAVSEGWSQTRARRAVEERGKLLTSGPSARLASHVRALREELAGLDANALSATVRREARALLEVLVHLNKGNSN